MRDSLISVIAVLLVWFMFSLPGLGVAGAALVVVGIMEGVLPVTISTIVLIALLGVLQLAWFGVLWEKTKQVVKLRVKSHAD